MRALTVSRGTQTCSLWNLSDWVAIFNRQALRDHVPDHLPRKHDSMCYSDVEARWFPRWFPSEALDCVT